MTWEQAMARANAQAARTGHRQRVTRCLDPFNGTNCPCGLWWVNPVSWPRGLAGWGWMA